MTSLRVRSKTVLFTILIPGTVAVAVPQLLARWRPHPRLPVDSYAANAVGTLSIALGALLYAHTAERFGVEGDGTPSPTDEPGALVTTGAYSYTRNPMYVSVVLVVLGQALRRRSVSVLWWAVGCWLGFHNRVIRYEEPHLAEKHGDAYERYRERVPRWLPTGRSRRER
ncbi:isoprenylcysteine carboxylmethyltransferase family protein [Natrarchaeobius oligotrophus]|uniref:Isoprenylcysteine carboxylmethyltransferase family protein n=1 Tax=Natrarchaeobius chitinivorans TaxID=1679083 RepID=A0A3N6PJ37_NATCH|nr:isoprenylcysteine carboxylmethyltransferase family protein [Natrarchaeobius chitinivorans]